MILLNALVSTYEHLGLELYKTHSYQDCRELLDIASQGRQNPEDKLQEIENNRFNLFLDKVAYNKFKWAHMSESHNLWRIKDMSSKLLNPGRDD